MQLSPYEVIEIGAAETAEELAEAIKTLLYATTNGELRDDETEALIELSRDVRMNFVLIEGILSRQIGVGYREDGEMVVRAVDSE